MPLLPSRGTCLYETQTRHSVESSLFIYNQNDRRATFYQKNTAKEERGSQLALSYCRSRQADGKSRTHRSEKNKRPSYVQGQTFCNVQHKAHWWSFAVSGSWSSGLAQRLPPALSWGKENIWSSAWEKALGPITFGGQALPSWGSPNLVASFQLCNTLWHY